MYARHRDAGLVLLGLSVDRGPAGPVREFVRQRAVTHPVAPASLEPAVRRLLAARGGGGAAPR